MSKIVISEVALHTNSNYTGATDASTLTNVVVDSREFSPEPNEVIVDAGRKINESYTINFTMRIKGKHFKDGTTAILSSALISTDGSVPTSVYPKFVGAGVSPDIEFGEMWLNGYESYSNGRVETVLEASLEVITASDGVTSA
jgi:hypothetical protein